jgi:hypothetical protein
MPWDGYPARKWVGLPPEYWVGMLLYVSFMMAAALVSRSSEGLGGWSFAVGLLPTIPMLMIMRGYLRMVRHQDELYRRVQLEAIAIAAGLTIVFCFTSWFLETFSGFPHLSIQWAGMLLIFSYGAAAGVLMRRYT